MSNKFSNGSIWVRFDCHLHTRADKEFKYSENENEYITKYIEKLKAEEIEVGIITNHNKFDIDEFKALKKKANKENIFILPGVELSVNDGSNGIHCLIVFNPDEWLENGNNYISQFIIESFAGKANYENENGRSNDNLITTIEKLNKYNKDYFIILAHVEQRSGFFEELDGGRIQEFSKHKLFRKNILAFQKVTKYDLSVWNQWFDNELPAFVEGSDPKKIDEIGKGEKSYIKIGDYNFEAVKFALQDKDFRVKKEKPIIENGYIKSISFDGSSCKLDGQTIEFSSSMNNLVGVRGAGKSSIIEAIRYGLDLPFGNNSIDISYKNELVKQLLGSAGKITIKIKNSDGKEFIVDRVFNHALEIKLDGELKNLNTSLILKKPLYFGQKDLSNYRDDFENDLISKLIGDKTKDIEQKIETKKQEIRIQLENIKKYDNLENKKEEVNQKIEELNLKIEEFKKHNIEEKLKKQIEFDKDNSNFTNIIKDLQDFRNDVNSFLSSYEDGKFFDNLKNYQSTENQDIFKELYKIIDISKQNFLDISNQLKQLLDSFKNINSVNISFKDKYKAFKDEFLRIQREINLPNNLRADDFINYTKMLNSQKLMKNEIEKSFEKKLDNDNNLKKLLSELNELYREEFKIIDEEVQKINESQESISIKSEFKANKNEFDKFLRNIFGGSGLMKNDYDMLTSNYVDPIAIYEDFENISLGGNKLLLFRERFKDSLASMLTYKVPNKIDIFYNGKELAKHSLGQRASALIIFILTQKNNDVIIIDQPEDDLDNQTIYKEVIKELIKLKSKTQFIFATHNANIPVLGDCEQIVVCDYEEKKINIEMGSIDNHNIQQKIINIMEGGKDAFNKRREIYNLWKH
ncbi:TrlF family AAA-like ATPase [Aliarcobacter cryaerophilus]|uniref:AAA family ATPase n=1 Tax=Arcobacter sp. AZ-2023 TaxID=3074453 RepID=A0AA96DKG4_9BACT|nr:AAA family ATPase [Arcobacter sp. AZ-2023]